MAGETKEGDAIASFQEPGLPSEKWFHNRGYLAGTGSWKKKLPAEARTTEMLLKAEREAVVVGRGSRISLSFPLNRSSISLH